MSTKMVHVEKSCERCITKVEHFGEVYSEANKIMLRCSRCGRKSWVAKKRLERWVTK